MAIDEKMETARVRSRLMRLIREFFDYRGHTEVETPVLSRQWIPESVIDTFSTVYTDPYRLHLPLRLLPSPEIWMKRLLSEGSGSIYQLTKSFRNSEAVGTYHNPEFTMLEWYTVDRDYTGSMELTKELLQEISTAFSGFSSHRGWLPAEKLTVCEAFSRFAGIDLAAAVPGYPRFGGGEPAPGGPLKAAYGSRRFGGSEESWETWFNRLFLSEVEPKLPKNKALFLSDYPAAVPCLAKPILGTPWVERWELYIGGIEIANCFTEERDEQRIREFMEGELAAIPEAGEGGAAEDFPQVCAAMPPCSGVALGLDRLLMALTGAEKMTEVLLFPFSLFF